MPTNFGAGLKQIVVVPAGLPGLANSCYSDKKTVSITSGDVSKVIPDIGELLIMPLTSVKVELQESSGVWTQIVATGGSNAQQIFSDATNVRFTATDTSTTRTASYYIIQ